MSMLGVDLYNYLEGGYSRISLDLSDPRYVGTDIPLELSGRVLNKISYNGDNSTYIKLNRKDAHKIYISEISEIAIPFNRLYLTNPAAQEDVDFVFYIGSKTPAGIKNEGQVVGLRDPNGVNIKPAREDGNLYIIRDELDFDGETWSDWATLDGANLFRFKTTTFKMEMLHLFTTNYAAKLGDASVGGYLGTNHDLYMRKIDLSKLYLRNYITDGSHNAVVRAWGTKKK